MKTRNPSPVRLLLEPAHPFPSALTMHFHRHRLACHRLPDPEFRPTGDVMPVKVSFDRGRRSGKPEKLSENPAILFRIASALEEALGSAPPGLSESRRNYAWIYLNNKKEDLYLEARMQTRIRDRVHITPDLAVMLSGNT